MKTSRIAFVLAAAALVGACGRGTSDTFTANNGPQAYVRFVNAIPDSGAGDWRFVDFVEGSPVTFGLAFRSMFPATGYQGAAAGSRHIKVFQSSTNIALTQVVFLDTTFTFVAGNHYTLVAAGTLRAPATAKTGNSSTN